MEPIIPESSDGNYPARCRNVDLALTATRERVEEWDRDTDPHGWWHQRPQLIALHNEVLRLRAVVDVVRSYVPMIEASDADVDRQERLATHLELLRRLRRLDGPTTAAELNRFSAEQAGDHYMGEAQS